MPTPPNTPINLRSGQRLVTAFLAAREAANAVRGSMNPVVHLLPQKGRPSFSRTKTITMPRTKKTQSKKDKIATVKGVKRMITGILEKKNKGVGPSFSSLIADTIYTFNLTSTIVQGTTDATRVGDSINLSRLMGNLYWYTAAASAFYRLRLIVGFSGEEYNMGAFSASGLTATELFLPGPTENLTSVVNPKAFTVLHDVILDANSQLADVSDGVTHRLNISLPKGKFNYQSNGSLYGKTRNLYAVVIGGWINPGAGVDPTNAGVVAVNFGIFYTDA